MAVIFYLIPRTLFFLHFVVSVFFTFSDHGHMRKERHLKLGSFFYMSINQTSISFSVADLKLRKNLSFSEDSDLSCDDVLERSSQKSKADVSSICLSRVIMPC